MAEKVVAARTEGDVYQAMFFWHQVCALLIESSRVNRVVLEHDAASGVDDVAVFYDPPGIADAASPCTADFYQLKYHVDRSDAYCSETIIDPDFIHAKKSLLQRFFDAYRGLRDQHAWFRLHLISNWRWRPDDGLANRRRERDGALPEKFFTDGPRAELGKIRESWRSHLGIARGVFDDFARRLRFGLDHFGRRWFKESLNDRLACAGLKRLPAECLANPYDSLAQQFVMNGFNAFDRKSFVGFCQREGLIDREAQGQASATVIGIRSFVGFADRIEDETSSFVCVAENFEGRHIRDAACWTGKILPKVYNFLVDPCFRQGEYHLLLDCHSSLAFLAGYELHRKSGAEVYPVQKGEHRQVWKPSDGQASACWEWMSESVDRDKRSSDLALAISITHNVRDDVEDYLDSQSVSVREIVHMTPSTGVGASSILGANHAVRLAEIVVQKIRTLRRGNPSGRVHLFAAAPNAFMFFLGRHRAALGPVQLYEFDFEMERGGSYTPSIALPVSST